MNAASIAKKRRMNLMAKIMNDMIDSSPVCPQCLKMRWNCGREPCDMCECQPAQKFHWICEDCGKSRGIAHECEPPKTIEEFKNRVEEILKHRRAMTSVMAPHNSIIVEPSEAKIINLEEKPYKCVICNGSGKMFSTIKDKEIECHACEKGVLWR